VKPAFLDGSIELAAEMRRRLFLGLAEIRLEIIPGIVTGLRSLRTSTTEARRVEERGDAAAAAVAAGLAIA